MNSDSLDETSSSREKQTKKSCKQCCTDKATSFGKAYFYTQLCKVCNGLALDAQRVAAKQRKDDFNLALSLVDVFELDIQPGNFHFVETTSGLLLFEKHLKQTKLAGLDTETRPMFKKGVSDTYPTALLQVALRCRNSDIGDTDMVFLIDLLTLSQNPSTHDHLSRVLFSFFGNAGIIKLGQGLDLDIKELIEAHSDIFFKDRLKCTLSTVLEISDLHDLYTEHKINPIKVSLQRMTFDHLNKKLLKSKKLTLSNWDRRPLSPPQVQYAACDALVLLRLFDHLTTPSPINTDRVISQETILSLLAAFTFNRDKSTDEKKEKTEKITQKQNQNQQINPSEDERSALDDHNSNAKSYSNAKLSGNSQHHQHHRDRANSSSGRPNSNNPHTKQNNYTGNYNKSKKQCNTNPHNPGVNNNSGTNNKSSRSNAKHNPTKNSNSNSNSNSKNNDKNNKRTPPSGHTPVHRSDRKRPKQSNSTSTGS